MKTKLLLLSLLFSFPGFAQQITITQEDLPSPTDTVRLSTSSPASPVNYTATGANHTWDFSGLSPVSQEVTRFVPVSASGYLSSYPANIANMASPVVLPQIIQENLGDIRLTNPHFFYLKNETVFQEAGIAGTVQAVFPLALAVPYQRPDVLYRLPLTYNQKDSSDAYFEINYWSLFSVYFAENRKRVNHVDGWGTLTTPFGTFPALRMVSTIYASDTIRTSDIPATRIQQPVIKEYKWLGKNQKLPLLHITTAFMDNQETVISISYRDQFRRMTPLSTSATRQTKPVLVYPSPLPSGQGLHLELPESGTQPVEVRVLNPLGQVVYAHSYIPRSTASISRFTIPAAELGSGKGMFLVQIRSGQTVTVKKVLRQ